MDGSRFFWTTLVCLACGMADVTAQQRPEVRLRFDEALREEVGDRPGFAVDSVTGVRPFACKLNRRRVTCEEAYDAVTLWNVRRVRIKNRRMRLTDSTRREKAKLLKFFVERDRRKGARPHLLGNVAGYTWSSSVRENGRRREVSPHISAYTLRREYDSARLAGREVSLFRVPEELWHPLSPGVRYELNDLPVPSAVFQFIDGLILRTLDIRDDDPEHPGEVVVTGRTYPDRMPLVIFEGRRSTIEAWLRMCTSGAFRMTAEVRMHYFYMLPLEAVQRYGRAGIYGAICIDTVD